MKSMPKSDQFWVTNITNMNISLADLDLTIKPYTSVNLLDKKHYYYTRELLEKSSSSGSLFIKRNKVVVRSVPPENELEQKMIISESIIPSRTKSVFIIKQENYEELNVSDEVFAAENADIAELDRKPINKG